MCASVPDLAGAATATTDSSGALSYLSTLSHDLRTRRTVADPARVPPARAASRARRLKSDWATNSTIAWPLLAHVSPPLEMGALNSGYSDAVNSPSILVYHPVQRLFFYYNGEAAARNTRCARPSSGNLIYVCTPLELKGLWWSHLQNRVEGWAETAPGEYRLITYGLSTAHPLTELVLKLSGNHPLNVEWQSCSAGHSGFYYCLYATDRAMQPAHFTHLLRIKAVDMTYTMVDWDSRSIAPFSSEGQVTYKLVALQPTQIMVLKRNEESCADTEDPCDSHYKLLERHGYIPVHTFACPFYAAMLFPANMPPPMFIYV